ncbi:hypothetical protein JR316_0005378 [Psilocybe cubensis]|uniref:Uncharacterized protein n=1 Tax=Psilocybe cubensis TaxID=181762 RepID=A0ACB8H7W5_PSICU|nr:hypothetical protein JR316_0005378 [Psilocybe cubensis]KAH9483274.1 hypothetical protein JR316_0005378 [Psilocybe cubensis]
MGPLSQPVFCNSASELKKARTTQRSDGNSIPPSELAMRYAQYFWIVFWTVSCLGTHRIIRKRWGLRGDHSFKGCGGTTRLGRCSVSGNLFGSVRLLFCRLLTSVVYSSQRIKFQRTDMVKKWKKVFLDLESAESVEFWACIALPFASLIWSTLFFISTAIAIAWGECKTPSDSWSPPEPAFCASGAAVTLILLLCTTQFSSGFK